MFMSSIKTKSSEWSGIRRNDFPAELFSVKGEFCSFVQTRIQRELFFCFVRLELYSLIWEKELFLILSNTFMKIPFSNASAAMRRLRVTMSPCSGRDFSKWRFHFDFRIFLFQYVHHYWIFEDRKDTRRRVVCRGCSWKFWPKLFFNLLLEIFKERYISWLTHETGANGNKDSFNKAMNL